MIKTSLINRFRDIIFKSNLFLFKKRHTTKLRYVCHIYSTPIQKRSCETSVFLCCSWLTKKPNYKDDWQDFCDPWPPHIQRGDEREPWDKTIRIEYKTWSWTFWLKGSHLHHHVEEVNYLENENHNRTNRYDQCEDLWKILHFLKVYVVNYVFILYIHFYKKVKYFLLNIYIKFIV